MICDFSFYLYKHILIIWVSHQDQRFCLPSFRTGAGAHLHFNIHYLFDTKKQDGATVFPMGTIVPFWVTEQK